MMDSFDFENISNKESEFIEFPIEISHQILSNSQQNSSECLQNLNRNTLEIVFQLDGSGQPNGEKEFYNINDLVDNININQQKEKINSSKQAIKSKKYRERKKQQEIEILNINEKIYKKIIIHYKKFDQKEDEIDQVLKEYKEFQSLYVLKVYRQRNLNNSSKLLKKDISKLQRERKRQKYIQLKILNENLEKINNKYFSKNPTFKYNYNFQYNQEKEDKNISDIKNMLYSIKQDSNSTQEQNIQKQQQQTEIKIQSQCKGEYEEQNSIRESSSQNNIQFESLTQQTDYAEISFFNTI